MTRSAEGHGATVDEAVQEALGELGLSRDEVEVIILSEGRRGLFGGGKRAHVRLTAKERAARAARSASGDGAEDEAAGEAEAPMPEHTEAEVEAAEEAPVAAERTPEEWMDLLDEEAEIAADFVEALLDRLDLPGDIEIEVDEQQATVNILEVGSGLLIGRRGATLDALQELVRGAVQRQTERRSHVRVDVEGYRARQLDKLRDKCRDAIAQVRETGKAVRLEPMDPYERKLMHDIVASTGGVVSASEGSEPRRRVVIRPE